MIQEIPKYYPECYIPQKLNDILHADSAPIKPIKPEILIKNPVKKKGLLGFVNSIFNNIFTKSYSKEFIAQKVKYENALNRYNKEEKKYQQQKQLYNTYKDLHEYRKALLKLEMGEYNVFSSGRLVKTTNKETKKGPGETYFLKYLKQHKGCEDYFMDNFSIIKNHRICFYNNKNYYPDIILKDKHGIFIDIEIDEPYTTDNNHQAIHYIGSDDYRNEYFTLNDWIVIRFCEQQIFKHTQECFDFIINIHKSIYACDLYALQIFEDFIYPKWSKKQALQWGQENYRETYLPYKLTKQQDKENKTL
ncbi:MAG: hypothetical protein IJ759_01985 [Bacteroidales bacterium]|nr:hypothetical protein [Bacteroidales bacterium]